MDLLLRGLPDPAGDVGLVLSTHLEAKYCPQLQFQRNLTPSSNLHDIAQYRVHSRTCRQYTPTYKVK